MVRCGAFWCLKLGSGYLMVMLAVELCFLLDTHI
jgi:hypothetical protein